MTCVVAVKDAGRVTLAGDLEGQEGWNKTARSDSKVFRRGSYAIGFTTSYRMGQALQYLGGDPPEPLPGQNMHAFMVREWIEWARGVLSEAGYSRKESEQEFGGEFLVAREDHLFIIGADFQVGIPSDSFAAIGCGSAYALGALAVLASEFSGPEVARQAIEIASRFCNGVGPWSTVVVTESAE